MLLNNTTLGVAFCMAQALPVQAQQPMQLPPVSVEGQSDNDTYKAEKAESPKRTAPLRDTPQTITVVTQELLLDQNLLSLREALSTVPGITFGAGEGGGGYGDSINLRGYSANTDITTDSLRDSAQYTRSDFFNIERIEVFNGANSVYSGSGAVGGTINLVTKKPQDEDFVRLTAGIGTDDYYRGAVDANQKISDTIGLRINAMAHRNDIPGRDVEEKERWGIAPAVTFGMHTPTRFTISVQHQEDNNIPEYGVPFVFSAVNSGPLPGVDPSDYFGYSNVDTQNIDIDSVTLTFEHDFSDTFAVRNMARWQQVDQRSIVNPPQGTYCLANGINPATGAACATPNSYQPSGPRGNTRSTTNKYLVNQLDLMSTFTTGSAEHDFVIGAAGSHESYTLDTGNVLRNPGGATPNPVLPLMTLSNPDTIYRGPLNYVRSGTQDATLDNIAVYAFDTITIIPELEFNAGVRYEHNSGDFTNATFTNGVLTAQNPVNTNSENLFSYRVGLVYKPIEAASIYAAYGNTRTPSKAAVNGNCGVNCNVDPEKGENIESGVKWDVAEERLSLSAAIFRNDRTNYKVASGDPLIPEQVLDGAARVDGIALGAAGAITDGWQVFANYTYLDSEVRQGVSDLTKQTTGLDPQAGNPLQNTPKHAFSAWTTYALPMGVTLGYGVTYQSKVFVNNAAPPLYTVPKYWVHRAMVAYAVNEQWNLQLNVQNLFDKNYYTRVRTTTSGWATPGEGRSATLTVNYSF